MPLYEALRQRLVAQAEIFAALSSHTTVTGSGRERALSDLLREVLPRRVEVLSGVVARMDGGAPARSARQVDIIIADTHNFPVLARAGDLAVVLPNSVQAIVEVKTRVSGDAELREAVSQLAQSRAECTTGHTWYSALFSYGYPTDSKALREGLKGLLKARDEATERLKEPDLDPKERPVLEKASSLVAALFPELIVSENGSIAIKAASTYQFYECDARAAAVVLVSEILNAVTNDLSGTGSGGTARSAALLDALEIHSRFLQVSKKQVLDDLAL